MKFILTFFFALLLTATMAQERNDIGFSFGSSNYIGDFNPTVSFANPQPSFGLLFRHNASNYYSIRASISMAWLSASPSNEDSYLPGTKIPILRTLYEGEVLAEIGFLPFNTKNKSSMQFSPYVLAGIGAASVDGNILPHIPIGIGAKYSFSNRLSLALELRLHKTSNDIIDGYANVTSSTSNVHNNDWFSFTGILISYRIFNEKGLCPVYR